MSQNGKTYRIVLEKSDSSLHPSISDSLAQCFGVPEKQALRIAEGAPIVLLSHLDRDQAVLVSGKLSAVKSSGAELVIEKHGARRISAITWPKVPKVLEDADIAPEAKIVVVRCPECDAAIKLDLNEVLKKANKKAIPVKPKIVASKPAEKKDATAQESPLMEKDESSLLSDMKPLIDAGVTGIVGSLGEFESGLIDLYETEVDDFEK